METGIEIELGVIGGEEDGVDNTDIDKPEDVGYAFSHLREIGSNFTVAASFGNFHGVYKSGNVKLSPIILKNSQEFVQRQYKTGTKPVSFVFHGGSGSLQSEIREAIDYGVIKMNIDTDMQWVFWEGVKNFYDPRVWLRKGEESFVKRLKVSFEDLNNINRNG